MIAGALNGNRELIVPVRVLDNNEHVHRFEVVVDTGFDGDLTLTPAFIAELGLLFSEPIDMVAATGATFRVDSYEGIVLWRGEKRPVRIIETEGRLLIGINLMWDSLLTAEIIDNGAVTIGQLPAEAIG